MKFTHLIDALQLHQARQDSLPPLVIDCSADLADASAGRRSYEQHHIPGAFHLQVHETLSGRRTGLNGRNPLPEKQAFVDALRVLGANDETQIVAYDNGGGIYAARLWWMLRWVGHDAVAVLDGGLPAWKAAGLTVAGGTSEMAPSPNRAPGSLRVRPPLVNEATYDDVRANLIDPTSLVVDARAADRFRGENEVTDPKAGHIPGAWNRPFRENLLPDGRFKPADQLRAEFDALLKGRSGTQVINQCGSGVSACLNLLAMEVAGLQGSALYVGSWSEWSSRNDAPVALGA